MVGGCAGVAKKVGYGSMELDEEMEEVISALVIKQEARLWCT